MDISTISELALKNWATKVYQDWEETKAAKFGKEARALSEEYLDDAPESIERWNNTLEQRVNYLMARPPVVNNAQEELDDLLPAIKQYMVRFLQTGTAIWLLQGDGESVIKKPELMDDVITIYTDKTKKKPLCRIRKYVEQTITDDTGAVKEEEFYEVYEGVWKHIFSKQDPSKDTKVPASPVWIEIGHTGDQSLYAKVRGILAALDKTFFQQDEAVAANTKPLIEIRGYSGTDVAQAREEINAAGVILTDGAGGVTVHGRSMDSASMQTWRLALLQMYYEATATVGKDNELQFALSGKALDRLFVQAENAANAIAALLEPAVKEAIAVQSGKSMEGEDIVWNTDRPVDDTATIANINASAGLLSTHTLLVQHPWVDNVEDEEALIAAEKKDGVEDLFEHYRGNEGLESGENNDGPEPTTQSI